MVGPRRAQTGRPRFAPRDPRRARYYKASLVAAGLFVVLALALPFWIDHVRRSRDAFVVPAPVRPVEAPVATAPPVPKDHLPYSPQAGHATCQAYATARCNALGIPPGPCGEVAAAALAVPATAGLAECRKVVEPKLEEAARLYKGSGEPEPPAEAQPPAAQVVAAQPIAPSPSPAREEGVATEPPSGTEVTQSPPRRALDPAQRADNLARIYTLVEELQRGAQNYATAPAAQAARFEELRARVEADGSEELRALYNTLVLQHGRTAGFEMPKPGLQAREAPMTPAAPGEERARTTTPEMDRVRGMLDEARRQAGQPTGPPPSTGPTAPPTSIDPATVQAPAAVSL